MSEFGRNSSFIKPLLAPLAFQERRITITKDISGGIRYVVEGHDAIIIAPEQAIDFGIKLLQIAGANVTFNKDRKLVHG